MPFALSGESSPLRGVPRGSVVGSRVIKIAGSDIIRPVMIGGGNSVVIQTMWKDRLSFSDLEGGAGKATVARIEGLADMGCALLRFAVPDLEGAEILGHLAEMVPMPLVADIHFDYKIALRCLDFPIAKIRINPGNIGGKEKSEKVISRAAEKGVPLRIGVNSGSLPRDLRNRVDSGTLANAEALVKAALQELALFDEAGFTNVVVSMKASNGADTMKANRLFAERSDAPLHIGVTEAGPLIAGVARSSVALAGILASGIGDTLRVSLSDTMENEVVAAREILALAAEAGNSRCARDGVTLVSCPRCGRNSFDTHGFTERWLTRLYALKKRCTVAVMGCAVNGPGEARHADLGITGAGNKVLLFRHGEVVRTIDVRDVDTAFAEELESI
jgi:(E)-4-hydroxy-3-methylbut-2-enyl-diphosphate synthase